jgi:hypothetical protein
MSIQHQKSEAQWAVNLQKARNATRLKSYIPFSIRKSQLEDRMAYYKNVLAGAGAPLGGAGKTKALETLIELRAELMALTLEEIQYLYGNIEAPALEAEMKKYYEECYRLAAAAA